jgi:hypothetical protein
MNRLSQSVVSAIASGVIIGSMFLSVLAPIAGAAGPDGQWLTGDIHTHTWLTDGVHPETDVLDHAFTQYGLNYFANSEHGGAYTHDPLGNVWNDAKAGKTVKLLGDPTTVKDANGNAISAMWRWQSLRDFSYPLLFGGKDGYGDTQPGLQSKYPQQTVIQGLEWNVPTHEHASVGIVGVKDGQAISDFEYQFDGSDKDKSRTELKKQNATADDAIAGVAYLQKQYGKSAYVMINHPSRNLMYTAADFRAMMDAAPDVAVGLEGMPGHQKEAARGAYGSQWFTDAEKKNVDAAKTALARTYGGADLMLAKVGGLMDSLWGEGRHFWVFVDSDFHSSADDADFYPGEYPKTYLFAKDNTPQSILDGMRSGNIFIVHGDLINALDFQAKAGDTAATIGQELQASAGSDITVTIRFKSPEKNNNGDKPVVDHFDLIAGDVMAKAAAGTDGYKSDVNPSTKVVATFTSKDWKADADGYMTVTTTLPKVSKSQYLRLRGTNLGMNVDNQMKDGNPLNDDLMGKNDKSKARADLWFYSNPIFVTVK